MLFWQALTKFLKCVNWDLPQEAKQALELLGKWRPMDVEDALELLSSQFTNPTVRRYAVTRMQQADDEVLPSSAVFRNAYLNQEGHQIHFSDIYLKASLRLSNHVLTIFYREYLKI